MESLNCKINCSGDENYVCGGIWVNLVYNLSFYVDKLVVNYFSFFIVFEWVNLIVEFVNKSEFGLCVVFDIGDENGDF